MFQRSCLDVLAVTECNDKVLVVIIASLHRFLPLCMVGTSSLERRTIQYVSLRDHVAHPKVAYIITLMKPKFYDSNCDFQQIRSLSCDSGESGCSQCHIAM